MTFPVDEHYPRLVDLPAKHIPDDHLLRRTGGRFGQTIGTFVFGDIRPEPCLEALVERRAETRIVECQPMRRPVTPVRGLRERSQQPGVAVEVATTPGVTGSPVRRVLRRLNRLPSRYNAVGGRLGLPATRGWRRSSRRRPDRVTSSRISRLNSDGISPVRLSPSPSHSSVRFVRSPSSGGYPASDPVPSEIQPFQAGRGCPGPPVSHLSQLVET